MMFIMGAGNAASVVSKSFDLNLFCITSFIPNEQLVRIVVRYGNQHPETLHLSAAPVVINSLIAAFPCKQR
jgi:hypothetical protein